jgi:hypothetical protein
MCFFLEKEKVSQYTHQASCSLDPLLLLIYALPLLLVALLLSLLLLPNVEVGSHGFGMSGVMLVGLVVAEG